MFNNPTIQSNITYGSFLNGTLLSRVGKNGFYGFGMFSSPNATYYYIMDTYYTVFILNDQWEFISSKVFSIPTYMINIGNSLYMTSTYNVWKVDQDLNILIDYNPSGNTSWYRGISYNPSNGLIYVVARNLN